MSCGCGKLKNGSIDAAMLRESTRLLLSTEWGPILWKYLHIIAEKIGHTGSKLIDTDQANYVRTLITMLPSILPCPDCQNHSETYLAANPFPSLKDTYGAAMRDSVRTWLFLFHNSVRVSKGQEPIDSIDFCEQYGQMYLSSADYTRLVQCIIAATKQQSATKLQWVRIDQWKKWYSASERLRLLMGNVVV